MIFNSLLLPLRTLPGAVHAELSARLFNHLLRGQPLAARLSEIEGKSVCIHVDDAPCDIHFRVQDGRLRAAEAGTADVRISGKLEAFWQLAARREDPDTLFFSRRLCIEGDTETGVHVKNLLDALDYDWQAHFRAVLGRTLGDTAFALLQRARR